MNTIDRREFLELTAVGGAFAFYSAAAPAPLKAKPAKFPSRPNIILVMTDDQGYGELGCHGNTKIKTPNLDQFYKESLRFNRFCVSPSCSPTRASLLTGRHEFRCGISHTTLGRHRLREDEVTIAEILKEEGYKTGIFGKWHLGDNYPCRPEDKGFQDCLYHGGGGITQGPDYWGNTYFNPNLKHNGDWEKTKGYCTDVFFDAALEWIEKNRDHPFFAYITPNAPHGPLQVSEEYAKPYEEMGLDSNSAKFYGMITNFDENMGRLIKRVRELGLEKKTLIIFLTDNGSAMACRYGLYNAGMRGCKGTVYEGGVRVPCFFRLPGTLEGGRDIEQLTAHIDMLSTLAELCGASLPEGRNLDGMSLVPILTGAQSHVPERYLITHVGRWQAGGKPPKYKNCSVRSQKYRWVENKELYDLEADPNETTNIIDERPDEAAEMREAYDKWWDEAIPRAENPQRIKLGAPEENPSVLCSFDWQESIIIQGEPDLQKLAFWNQSGINIIAKGEIRSKDGKIVPMGAMGSWRVEITRSGKYSITLRKLPAVASEEWKFLKPGEAHLLCGKIKAEKKIEKKTDSVTFEVRLEKGQADLECWFTGQRSDGQPTGACFVEVKYLV